jgi:uncharacterized protein (DUF362 family)
MARWSPSSSFVLVAAAALAAAACHKSSPPAHAAAAADAAPAPAPAPAPSPDAAPSADIVAHASDLAPRDAGPGAVETAGRTLTIDKPFFGGDGHPAAVVFVARGDDPADLVKRALDGAGVAIPTDRRVILKVNLGGFDRMKPGKPDNGLTNRITDPAVLRALILELRARGVTDLAVADGRSAPAEEWPKLLALSGVQPILDETHTPFIDLNAYGDADARPRPFRVKAPWAHKLEDELLLSADLIDPDPAKRPFLIDVAKLKAHRFAVMSLSIKNLMGAVMMRGDAAAPAWLRRWRMHRELSPWLDAWKKSHADDRAAYRAALADFSERLADLYGILTPDLAIIEGLPAVQGDGFAEVIPYGGAGIVIASQNACYADWTAARFFGWSDSDALENELGVRAPPAILAVASRYFGGVDGLAKITVRGDTFLPEPGKSAWFKAMAPFEIGARP